MRIQLAAVIGVFSLALLAPGGASASPHVHYGVQDDAWLVYGPEAPAKRIQILQRLGVDVVRLTLRWDTVAQSAPTDPRDPDDPAYDWGLYDSILQRLRAAHISVLLSLWGTPPWANGEEGPNFLPKDATALASFAYAASKKYPWITVDGLDDERAAVPDPELAAPLRHAPSEPGLPRSEIGEPAEPRRRRRDVAAEDPERRVTNCVDPRHARRARLARCVRAEPVSSAAGRDADERRLLALHRGHDGDAAEADHRSEA
jgi:hypothetical protein